MSMSIILQPLIALIAGILILIMPRLLNYIVAIYLIVIGLVGLFPPPDALTPPADFAARNNPRPRRERHRLSPC